VRTVSAPSGPSSRPTAAAPDRAASAAPSGSGGGGAEAFPAVYASTRRFTVGVPRTITVLEDGRVLFLRSRDGRDPVLCLWVLDGGERLLVDPRTIDGDRLDADLPPAERARRERARESAGGIVGYAVDRTGRRACFDLAGTLFVVDLATGQVASPPVHGPVFDPRLSPDGSRVAYVSGDDLRIVDLDGPGGDRALVTGGRPVSWGRAEFIAAEEMQRSRGHWWSPSGDRLLVTRVDESIVQRWWIADPAHPDREPTEVRYPSAGTANARVELHLVELDGSTRPIAWDDDGRFEYLANVVWSAEHPPLVVRQTRQQREVSIAALDTDSLALVERRSVTDDIWVELIPSSPTPSADGLLTIEDLSPGADEPDPAGPGRRALLLDGRPLTGPELNVRSIVRVVGHHAIVTAWTVPTEIHVLAVPLAAGGPPTALTSRPGVHAAVVGGRTADGTLRAVITGQRPDDQVVEVTVHPVRLGGGGNGDGPETLAVGPSEASIADVSLRSPIAAMPTFHRLGADRLESALFLPSSYDGASPLPVLLDPYGGPHAQRVLKHHTPHLVSQWFAEQGFAVLVTDGRGTPGRGPAWERQIWGDLAEPVLTDQLEALDAAADEFEILDVGRVAIRGWSFGGYLAALAVLRHPDRFHAAVAGAPVTTWRLYDTHYTERYLGRPDLHPLHYGNTDLLAEANQLVRPLLLIHGLADDNVVAAHTLRLSSALLAAGAPHRVLPLSGVTHMTPQEVVAENLLWFQLDFLREALGIGPEPGGAGSTS
jgi:dipeptidyl-peptidase-4